jgi:hypothetical protein
MLAQAAAGPYSVSLAIVVAFVFVALIRVIDPNEKEPLWATSVVFVVGGFAGMLLPLLVGPTALELSLWWSSVARELATFTALAIGLAILAGVGRWRGWPEVNGLMDGVVFGTAAGLGTATGMAFTLEAARRRVLDRPSRLRPGEARGGGAARPVARAVRGDPGRRLRGRRRPFVPGATAGRRGRRTHRRGAGPCRVPAPGSG